jgi:hypothetical protein
MRYLNIFMLFVLVCVQHSQLAQAAARPFQTNHSAIDVLRSQSQLSPTTSSQISTVNPTANEPQAKILMTNIMPSPVLNVTDHSDGIGDEFASISRTGWTFLSLGIVVASIGSCYCTLYCWNRYASCQRLRANRIFHLEQAAPVHIHLAALPLGEFVQGMGGNQ